MNVMTVNLEAWQAIAGVVALVVVGIENRMSQRKTRKAADKGAESAQKAVEQTVSTSNGFAKFVTESLIRLELQGHRTEKKIDDHIQAHANSDVMKK